MKGEDDVEPLELTAVTITVYRVFSSRLENFAYTLVDEILVESVGTAGIPLIEYVYEVAAIPPVQLTVNPFDVTEVKVIDVG